MKCLACGRVMLNKGTHFVCPNLLCDYSEEIENREARLPELILQQARSRLAVPINPATKHRKPSSSLACARCLGIGDRTA